MSYGKVHSTFWDDEKIIILSDDAKFMALYLVSNRHRNMLGAYRVPLPYIAHDLRWAEAKVSAALQPLIEIGFIVREPTGWTHIVNAMRHDPPENPNQVRARAKLVGMIPASNVLVSVLTKSPIHLSDIDKSQKKPQKERYADVWQTSVKGLLNIPDGLLSTLPIPLANPDPDPQPEPDPDPDPVERQGPLVADALADEAGDENLPAPIPADDLDIPLEHDATTEGAAVRYYNEKAKSMPWTSVCVFDAARRRLLTLRLKQCGGLDAWQRIIDRAATSGLLNGTARRSPGHEKWRMDFDFVLKASKFRKLREGSYNDENARGAGPQDTAFADQGRRDRAAVIAGVGKVVPLPRRGTADDGDGREDSGGDPRDQPLADAGLG